MIDSLEEQMRNAYANKASAFESGVRLLGRQEYYTPARFHLQILANTRVLTMALLIAGVWCNKEANAQSRKSTVVSPVTNDVNSVTYQKCRDKVATLSGSTSKGTGFLCRLDGKKWLVTNKHVANHEGNMEVSFLDGRTFRISNSTPMELAENRDLVRFEMPDAKDVLEIAEDVPDIGTPIEFYGNALGGDVITMTAGKVLSVGFDTIEIDAKIQGGNSGSPLVRIRDGKVIGVTTLSTFNKADDPSKIGTRFDPSVSATREFAVRFTGVKWIPMKYENFLYKVAAKNEVFDFERCVEIICFNDMGMVLEYKLPDIKFKTIPSLKKCLFSVSKEDMKLRKLRDKFDMMCEKKSSIGSGRMGGYTFLDFEGCIKSIKRQTISCYQVRVKMMKDFARVVSLIDLQEEDKDFVLKEMDEYIRKYEDKNRQHLKGFDLPNIPENPCADMLQNKKRWKY